MTPTLPKIQLTVKAENNAQYRGMVGAYRVVSLVCRAAPARPFLLVGIVHVKLGSKVGFVLEECFSAP